MFHTLMTDASAGADKNESLYWVEVGPERWETWPGWECRRAGIDPAGLSPVGEGHAQAA